MLTGTLKKYFEGRGFGFISPDDGGKEVYIHISKCNDNDAESLSEGDKVSFDNIEYWSERKGKMKTDAINCTVIGGGGGGGGGGGCTGTVRKPMDDERFGFIAPDGGGALVAINGGAVSLSEGDVVSFDNLWNDRAELMEAINCKAVIGGGEGGGGEETMTGTVR